MTRRADILRAVAAAAVVVLLAGLVSGGDHRSGRDGLPVATVPEHGSGGVGDPYYPTAGNSGYDAEHYELSLAWSAESGVLSGTATITATATERIDRFHLDLSPELTVASVEVSGERAAHASSDSELVITPAESLVVGREFTVVVDYAGVPEAGADFDGSPSGWIRTDDGVVVLAEPIGAPSWFPVNDHPSDKATYSVSMTVRDGLTVVGNGELSSRSSENGRTTFVWEERSSMASYLATVCIGPFVVTESETAGGTPLYLAVDPREAADSADGLAMLPEILDFEAEFFGPYPFETAGAIVDSSDVGYALETQTKPVYSFAPSAGLLVHEMAHQWFGDSVSLESWKDIWLNEGFATYAEWLWSEHVGDATPQEFFDTYNARTAGAEDFWNPPPGDPGPDNLFAVSVYVRGAMTLHALRTRIGDPAFWRLVKEWTSTHRHGNASTADFVALAEDISGKSLDRLFAVWLYQPGKPTDW